MCSLKVRFTQSPERRGVFEYALRVEVISAEGIPSKIFVYHQMPKGIEGNTFAEFDHVATPVDFQEIPEDSASDTVPWYRTDKVTVWMRNAHDLKTAKQLFKDDIACLQNAYNILTREEDFTNQETVEFNGGSVARSIFAIIGLSCMTAFGAEVYKTEYNTLDLDTNPIVVTNVTFDGLATTNDIGYSMIGAIVSGGGSGTNYSVRVFDHAVNLLSSSGLTPTSVGNEYILSFNMDLPERVEGKSRDFYIRYEMAWIGNNWYRVRCLFPNSITIEHENGEVNVDSPRMSGKPVVTIWHLTETKENVFSVTSSRMVDTACPMLTHRWSFNGNYIDSVTGESPLSFFGKGFSIVNNELVLNGNGWGSGSIVLDKGTLGTGDATVEIWATQNAIKNNSLIFDYSNFDFFEDTQYEVYLQWTAGIDLGKDSVLLKSGGAVRYSLSGLGSGGFALGVKYYIAITFHDMGDGSTFIRVVKIRVSDHSIVFNGTATVPYWTLNSLTRYGATFSLGLYKTSVASDANASYDEVRVWNTALSQAAIEKSELDGPDATIGCLNETLRLSGGNSVRGGYEYLP